MQVVPPAMRRERMSAVYTAWLRMDSDSNLMMMIVAVLVFAGPSNLARLQCTLENRLLAYTRFRSQVVKDLAGGAWWQEEPLGLRRRVVHVSLEGSSCNKPTLEQLVGKLSTTPLDSERPLWQMQVVDNFIGEDSRVRQAVVVRIHHCIADGMALVAVLLSMFDQSADAPELEAPSRTALFDDSDPWLQRMQPVTKTTISVINVSTALWTKYIWMLAGANTLMGRRAHMRNVAARLTLDAISLTTMSDDSRTLLKGRPCGTKRVAWSEPVPLDEIKVVGKALGCSVNDVLMASVAGAIGAYLRAKGDEVPEATELRWSRSTCAGMARIRSLATRSGGSRWCCRLASKIRSRGSTRCAAAWMS
jgi:diacylglycerol O-acyltransferase / wax synthase